VWSGSWGCKLTTTEGAPGLDFETREPTPFRGRLAQRELIRPYARPQQIDRQRWRPVVKFRIFQTTVKPQVKGGKLTMGGRSRTR